MKRQHLPTARSPLEEEMQATVEAALTSLGYLWFHDRALAYAKVRANNPGFPDLCAVHTITGAMVFIELKSAKGTMSHDQIQWMEAITLSPALYLGPVWPHQLDLLLDRLTELATSTEGITR